MKIIRILSIVLLVQLYISGAMGFKVTLKPVTGKAVEVDADSNTTVYGLKCKAENLSLADKRLIYKGKPLENSKTLAEYGITNDVTLGLEDLNPLVEGESFDVIIKTLTGKSVPITVTSKTTVGQLRQMINDNPDLYISPQSQRLIFAGRQLNEDAPSLKDCEIFKREATIHLVLRLRGSADEPYHGQYRRSRPVAPSNTALYAGVAATLVATLIAAGVYKRKAIAKWWNKRNKKGKKPKKEKESHETEREELDEQE